MYCRCRMSSYKVIDDYLNLLKSKRDLSSSKSENQLELDQLNESILKSQSDLILTIESVLQIWVYLKEDFYLTLKSI